MKFNPTALIASSTINQIESFTQIGDNPQWKKRLNGF